MQQKLAEKRAAGVLEKLILVDFCAGCGHSSLPLAYLYPESLEVIILENKQRSLEVAHRRAVECNLKNVICLQSNLENYYSKFDIGIALHACGPATDMVLDKIRVSNASFVVVPCCYGRIATLAYTSDVFSKEGQARKEKSHEKIHNENENNKFELANQKSSQNLSIFPKSEVMRELKIDKDKFCLLSRAADMDQAKGYEAVAKKAMKMVDWDRLFWMGKNEYKELELFLMYPEVCATKNHVLVGLAN